MAKKLTIRDIAAHAGVSHTTVSLVLNNKESRVSAETKARILQIAQDMNYIPNQIAVSLATQKTHTIGLITPDLTNMFLSSLGAGVEMYAQTQGYSVFFCNCNEDYHKCIDYIHEFVKRKIDGLVVIPPSGINNEGYLELAVALEESDIPYILVDRAVRHLSRDFITIDNKLGGFLATEHLLELGHKKIGCITGPLTEFGAQRRLQGYRDALEKTGIPITEAYIFEGNYHFYSGVRGAERLLAEGVTAIFACNDMMALGVNKYATDHGLVIPRDLSLVGFDNNPVTEFMSIGLTTISQPYDLMGRYACEILLNRIDGEQPLSNTQKSNDSLTVRGSTVSVKDLIDKQARENAPNKYKDYFFSPSLIVRHTTAAPKEI